MAKSQKERNPIEVLQESIRENYEILEALNSGSKKLKK